MKPIFTPPFFVFDVESVGLHGATFAVGGGIYDAEALPIHEFAFHCEPCPFHGTTSDRLWVDRNVSIHKSSIDCADRTTVRQFFWNEWMHAKDNHKAQMFVECGWPVEARFLQECIHDAPGERNWQGPYPMHEIASIMASAGMDPMDSYLRRPNELPAHEPLADARLSARLLVQANAILTADRHHQGELFQGLERLIIKGRNLSISHGSGSGMGLYWTAAIGNEWPFCSGSTLQRALESVVSQHLEIEKKALQDRINEIDGSSGL